MHQLLIASLYIIIVRILVCFNHLLLLSVSVLKETCLVILLYFCILHTILLYCMPCAYLFNN